MSDQNAFGQPSTPLSLEEISTAISLLNRFYDYSPHSWGEIEQTVNALDECRWARVIREAGG